MGLDMPSLSFGSELSLSCPRQTTLRIRICSILCGSFYDKNYGERSKEFSIEVKLDVKNANEKKKRAFLKTKKRGQKLC